MECDELFDEPDAGELEEIPAGWWRTKDGTLLRIADMDDDHLYYATRMLERHAQIVRDITAPPNLQGEMAQYYAEREWDAMWDMGPDELAEYIYPKIEELKAEMARRRPVAGCPF